MKFRLLVEFDAGTKRWSAVFPELPGCASAGDSEQEAIENAKEALALWFERSELKLKKTAKLLDDPFLEPAFSSLHRQRRGTSPPPTWFRLH